MTSDKDLDDGAAVVMMEDDEDGDVVEVEYYVAAEEDEEKEEEEDTGSDRAPKNEATDANGPRGVDSRIASLSEGLLPARRAV